MVKIIVPGRLRRNETVVTLSESEKNTIDIFSFFSYSSCPFILFPVLFDEMLINCNVDNVANLY